MDHYSVMGNPIQHSKSPAIHRLFAEQLGDQLSFEPILVMLDGLVGALADFQAQGGKGVSITLPFKHRAFTLADELSDRAKRAEAINMIHFRENGSRYGDNTDGVGLIRDIVVNHEFPIHKKRVLLLGAGGAVQGVIDPILQEEPLELIIANRTESKAEVLAEKFADAGPIQSCDLASLSSESFDLVINGTSASLQNEMLELPQKLLRKKAFCYDMVYGKGLTPFLVWAKEQDAALCSNGLGMLVEQAAESYYLWRGTKPKTAPVLTFLQKGEL